MKGEHQTHQLNQYLPPQHPGPHRKTRSAFPRLQCTTSLSLCLSFSLFWRRVQFTCSNAMGQSSSLPEAPAEHSPREISTSRRFSFKTVAIASSSPPPLLSNIFIEKDMRVKVGDFGLSRLLVCPETTSSSSGYVWIGPQGTPGYLDPDYHRSFRLTDKSDVYSFDVVLLELISGLKAVDQRRDKRELALADLVVSKIQMGLLHQVVDPVLVVVTSVIIAVFRSKRLSLAATKEDPTTPPSSPHQDRWRVQAQSPPPASKPGPSNPPTNPAATAAAEAAAKSAFGC